MFRPVTLAVFIAGIFLGGIYGLAVGKFKVFPYDYLRPSINTLKRLVAGELKFGSNQNSLKGAPIKTVDTTLITLKVAELRAPEDVEVRRGGGMTSLGNTALVVTGRGEILIFDGEELRHSKIETPDNGYDAYVHKAETKFADYIHKYERLRYNDLLFIDDGQDASLAISYIHWFDDKECYANVVALLSLPADLTELQVFSASASDWNVIYQSRPCLPLDKQHGLNGHMMGGRLTTLGNGKIAIVNGMGINRFHPQHDDTDMGRVLEIPLDGSPVHAINKGLRNPLGLLKDSQGRIWTVEHGPYGGDELNLIREGQNYGWPYAAYGVEYSRLPIPSVTRYGRHLDSQAPVMAWVPSIAPSNLIEVDGFDPAWDGDLIVATLKTQSMYRLRMDGDRVVYAEQIVLDRRLRYLEMHGNEQMLAWTDSASLLVITAAPVVSNKDTLDATFERIGLSDDLEQKTRGSFQPCMECHSIRPGRVDGAPSLSGIGGRKIAGGEYSGYSSALSSISGEWTKERLSEYLIDPQRFAPGTKMPNTGLKDDELTDALVQFLMKLP